LEDGDKAKSKAWWTFYFPYIHEVLKMAGEQDKTQPAYYYDWISVPVFQGQLALKATTLALQVLPK
jgi:hypothetical protein